jgi:hypothetical protein
VWLLHGSTPFGEILCDDWDDFSIEFIESDEVTIMTFNKRAVSALLSIAAMAILILDSKTALTGVAEGVELCMKVVIPSLFPFLILSTVLTASTFGINLWFLRPLCRLCRIPNGAAPLLLVGMIGGYPVGAQCITRAWKHQQLSTPDARRMLGFCSNAGPAFIFGMTGGLFDTATAVWALWLIQIAAAVITGFLLPGGSTQPIVCQRNQRLSPSDALSQAITAMKSICGWVIVFRIMILFCDKWFFIWLPETIQCLISGLLELTNGCCRLVCIPSDSVRFILCSILLSSGGLGVFMQTMSVTQDLGTGSYLPGKLIQIIIAAMLSLIISSVLFPWENILPYPLLWIPTMAAVIYFIKILRIRKNNSGNLATQRV